MKANKPNGRQGQPKAYPRNDQMSKGRSGNERNNLPSYYYTDPVVADEISRFSFNKIIGASLVYHSETPGIMRITMNPSIGVTPVPNGYSPTARAYEPPINKGINAAGRKLWFNLTAKTGRSATYSKVDVETYICAIGSLIGLSEHIRRVFGVANIYSIRNRLFLYRLIESMGVDPSDFLSNVANYRKRFNKLIAIMNGFPIPTSVDFFAKEQELYEKLYKDSDSSMCQLYFFAPSTVWQLDETSYPGGSVLRTRPIFNPDHNTRSIQNRNVGNHGGSYVTAGVEYYTEAVSSVATMTMQSLLTLFEEMLNAIADSSTMDKICADLLNLAANGGTTFWTFDTCPDDYWIEPELNPYVMLQIHNMMATGTPCGMMRTEFEAYVANQASYTDKYRFGTPANDVYPDPDTDTLVYNPSFKYTSEGTALGIPYDATVCELGELVVDSISPAPTLDDRIEMTRYITGNSYENDLKESINFFNKTLTKGFYLKNYVLPDHYPVLFSIFTANKAFEYTSLGDVDTVLGSFTSVSGVTVATATAVATQQSRFDWAPALRMSNSSILGRQDVIGNLNYFTTITSTWLEDVNDLAYIALFDLFKATQRHKGRSSSYRDKKKSSKDDFKKNPKETSDK